MRARGVLKGLAGAVALLLMYPFAAYADNVTPDGDVSVSGNDIVLTGACQLPSNEVAGQVAVKRTGNEHFSIGDSLSVSYTTSSGQIRVDGPSSVTVPSDYVKNGTSEFYFPIKTQVTQGTSQGAGFVKVTVSRPGLSVSGEYNVSWNCAGNTAPSVTLEGVSDGATYDFGQVPVATCAVVDAEDGSSSFAAKLTPLTGPRADVGLGEQTASCEYTDTGGLKATASATYSIADLSPPVMLQLTDVAAEATGPDGAAVTLELPAATDAVDGDVEVVCEPQSAMFPLGATEVQCSATDLAGNTSTDTLMVNVVDTTAPVLHLPDSMTVEATSAAGATATFTATATDVVDGDVAVTCTPASGSVFDFGTTTVACTATDSADNSSRGSFAVTVQDKTAPAVTVPGNITLEATGPDGATHVFEASAVDAVDGNLEAVCEPASGSTFPLGDTTVECSATDTRGNTGQASFVVTVEDTIAPELQLPANIVAEATGPNGAFVDYEVTATDIVDGTVTPVCSAVSGDAFPLGATDVNCTVTDAAGNTASGSFKVTVRDTTPPEMPAYRDIHGIEATGPQGATVTFDAGKATDLVSGDVPVTCEPASGSVFALGTTPVSCTATDAAGNTGKALFQVTVVDTKPPVLDLPGNTTIEATGPMTAIEYAEVTATDVVDGELVATCSPASGTEHPLGEVPVTCTVTDKAGNSASGSFTITVQDKTAPVMPSLENMTVEATSSAGAVVNYGPFTAEDLVDGTVDVTCEPASGSVLGLGESRVNCSAIDGSGNTGTSGFMVTVVDSTAPTLTVPGPITVEATSASGTPVTFDVSAVDAVTETPTVTCSVGDMPVQSGAVFPLGTTTVDCTATDEAGNTGSASFAVTVSVGWGGFLQPLNPGGPKSFKLNSTIPVKFHLAGASAGITNLDARLYVRRIGNATGDGELAAISTSAASTGNAFRWDADGGHYIFNLSTKAIGSGTYELRVDLGDDVARTIQVEIRK